MLWLALNFPGLALEIFNTDNTKPFVVLQDNRVCSLNQAALDSGIKAGSSLATAYSIYPALCHQQRDEQAEQRRLRDLADTMYRFSSYVSVQNPDCILLEIGASLKLFGNHSSLSRQAVELCHDLGHCVVARTAATPWAGIALARSGCRHLQDVPLSAAGMELAAVSAEVVERFANMGIYNMGQLMALPDKALGKRFGKPLLFYLQQLQGIVPDPRRAITPRPSFKRTLHLLQPVTSKSELYEHAKSPVQKLLHELQHWLIAHQMGCQQLLWKLHSHNHETVPVSVHFAAPKQKAADFLRITRLKLEQTDLPGEILSTGLQARHLQRASGDSQHLFKTHMATDMSLHHAPHTDLQKEMAELIDEFSARLGGQACYGIQSRTQHTPEQAWQLVQPHQLLKPLKQAEVAHHFAPQAGNRPLWLFDPPRRIARADIELLQGPERIQSQWWQAREDTGSAMICRDYYIAQHRLGAQCWAFVDMHDEWYLHGYFG